MELTKIKNRYFESIKIDGIEYYLSGSSKGGSDCVYDLISENERKNGLISKYVIKIHTKGEYEKKRFENEILFLTNRHNDVSRNAIYIIDIITSGIIKYKDENNDYCFKYYVMPKIKGSFRDIINNSNISVQNKLKYFIQLCRAVKYLHDRKIIHRDIKPENILFDSDNKKVILCDFGISHFPDLNLTEKDERLANRNYCAPEQRVKNGIIGTYSDIYSLGLILNELFTKEIASGEKYKKISEFYPYLVGLDEIVSSMIQFEVKRREYDINAVIEKVLSFNRKYGVIYGKYYNYALNGRKDTKSRIISGIYAKDILTLLNYINQNNTLCDINVNYHQNIHCSIVNNTFKSELELAKIKKILEKKFFYENVEFNDGNYDTDIYQNDELSIIEFKNIMSSYYNLRDENYGTAFHYFYSINNYHQVEVINTIKTEIAKMQDDFKDSTIFFFAKMVDSLISYPSWDNFGFLIKPNILNSDINVINNDIFEDSSLYMIKCAELIKNKWQNSTIIYQEKDIKVIMKISDFNKFKELCLDYSLSLLKNDIKIIDIEDMLNAAIKKNRRIYFWLSEYDYHFLIPHIFNKENHNHN